MTSPRTNPGTRTGPNPAILIGAVVAVLVVAAIAVFATAGGGDDSAAADVTQFGIVTVDGDPLPTMPEQGADPAVGDTVPTLISDRPEGIDRIEPGASGNPTMVVFLAHWCPHCQRELPVLVDMDTAGVFAGIDTVAVLTATTSSRDNFPPSAWIDDEQWTGETFYDDDTSTAGQAYGLSGFPMLVFLDADGVVVERLSGEQPADVIAAAVAKATGTSLG